MPFVTNNFDTSGADKYNALQVSLQKRTGAGLTYLVSYTLSKYLTNTDSGFSTFNFRGIDPNNPNQEWSVGNNDQTHVLTMAGVYELPIGPGKKFLNRPGLVGRNLLGGWKITMTNYYESGTPLRFQRLRRQPVQLRSLNWQHLCGQPAEPCVKQLPPQLEQLLQRAARDRYLGIRPAGGLDHWKHESPRLAALRAPAILR